MNKIRKCLKKIVNFLLSFVGLEVNRKLTFKKLSFDQLHFFLNKDGCTIIDVGGSIGQSIDRFKKIFPNSLIHSFEPIKNDFEILEKNYGNDNSIKLNNFAFGEKKETKTLYINAKSDCSSFYKVNIKSDWLKIRSQKLNISPEEFTVSTQETKVTTIDEYVKENNLKQIDILKIDTQGTEDKVLEGAKESLKKILLK